MILIHIFKESFFFGHILKTREHLIESCISNKSDFYYKKVIAKKRSGFRTLHCLREGSDLHKLQTELTQNFLNKIPLPNYVCGFVSGKSYRDYLSPHIRQADEKKRYYLRLDIKDFFSSLYKENILSMLKSYFRLDPSRNEQLLEYIAELSTLDGVLPQGAISSPALSNVLFRKMDIRINKYCKQKGYTYTRYGDDLLFSSLTEDLHSQSTIFLISSILESGGFILNKKKIRKGINEISLNGFVVGSNLRVSRSKRVDIGNILYLYATHNPTDTKQLIDILNSDSFKYRSKDTDDDLYFSSENALIHYLSGYRAMLIGWLPENRNHMHYIEASRTITQLEDLLIKIHNMK
ncbi:reverse transcriptase family protein [Paenibacillus sp. FSL R5-0749]|uniref:reverse transcriptase family protein n=1 Tax=Paenibacillus sp. FSL R5-0749 TaxID=2921657 RepID=UPI003159CA32